MRASLLLALALVLGGSVSAETLLVPFVAHDSRGQDGTLWSSEIYLTNPTLQPVQVSVLDFLPGSLDRSRPCDLPTAPTRVVPPLTSVVWTTSGIATDLGCADRAIGALVLEADGEVIVTARTVSHPPSSDDSRHGLLTGSGQEVDAMPLDRLPPAGEHLLPSLVWHRNPCGPSEFDTFIGFANPGDEEVTALIDIPAVSDRGGRVALAGAEVDLPHAVEIPPRSWLQVRLAPAAESAGGCLGPSSFMAVVTTDGPVAFYASVVSRGSSDPRTVLPVPAP